MSPGGGDGGGDLPEGGGGTNPVTTIQTSRNYRAMGEDMISAALFPPDSAYTTFTTGQYGTNSRNKGGTSLKWFKDVGFYPLIMWHCTPSVATDFTAQMIAVTLRCKILFACQNESMETAKQSVAADISRAMEVLNKQTGDTALAFGPFYLSHSTAVSGKAGTIYGVSEVVIGEPTEPDNMPELAADVAVGVLPVNITVLMD